MQRNSVTIHRETHGWLEYDPKHDEFTSLAQGPESVAINHPISAGCLVTGRCNLFCGFCYGNREALPKNELNAEEWGSIFKNLRRMGLMRVDLSGGEPTLHKELLSIVERALKTRLNVVLSTNGLVWEPERYLDLPRTVRLHVSIDSGMSEIHDASRRKVSGAPSTGALARTTKMIERVVAAGFRVRVLTCLGSHNASDLLELAEILAAMPVDEWNISRILHAGRAKLDYSPFAGVNDDDVLAQVRLARELYPWVRIRYSNRTRADGYFFLVLPDGSAATQRCEEEDKVSLGHAGTLRLSELQRHPSFNLAAHVQKWIAAESRLSRLAN